MVYGVSHIIREVVQRRQRYEVGGGELNTAKCERIARRMEWEAWFCGDVLRRIWFIYWRVFGQAKWSVFFVGGSEAQSRRQSLMTAVQVCKVAQSILGGGLLVDWVYTTYVRLGLIFRWELPSLGK